MASSTHATTENLLAQGSTDVPVQIVVKAAPAKPKISKRKINYIKGAAGISSKPHKPVIPVNGLAITEQYFHRSHQDGPQVTAFSHSKVTMMIGGRVLMPTKARKLSVNRIVDICKLTAAQFYRTAAVLNYETQTFEPMGTSAQDIQFEYVFTPFADESTPIQVANQEINHRYQIQGAKLPFWRVNIISSPEIAGDGIVLSEEDIKCPDFYVYFSFHHCIADGLSAYAMVRTFYLMLDAKIFNAESLELDKVPIVVPPPALLDNYIKPNVFEVLLPAADMIMSQMRKKGRSKHALKQLIDAKSEPSRKSFLKLKMFDAEFQEDLRKTCRENKTSLTGPLIISALYAARKVFKPRAEAKKKPLTKYQSWVVTSSTRHLLPNSKLLEGGDKETDPSVSEFGGYGSSISDEHFKFDENSELWDRCRSVRQTINGSFIKSMRKLKLTNYVYRRKKIWNALQSKVDLQAMQRTYTVELANLGAWGFPCAPLDAPDSDERVKADWFFGSQNNSFEGARAIFSIGSVSIGGIFSILVSFDADIISDAEAEIFMAAFAESLDRLRSTASKISLKSLENRV